MADDTAAKTAAIIEIGKAVVNNNLGGPQLGLQHLKSAALEKQNAG